MTTLVISVTGAVLLVGCAVALASCFLRKPVVEDEPLPIEKILIIEQNGNEKAQLEMDEKTDILSEKA